jgi:4-hydroxybenzoate polyprenyltransferase
MQDKKDDTKAGISSTAVLFGDHARLILGFFASLFVLGLLFIGVVTHQHLRYFILSVLGSALHFTWQITTVNFEDAQSCVYRFKSNGTQLGYIAWSGMLANYALSA